MGAAGLLGPHFRELKFPQGWSWSWRIRGSEQSVISPCLCQQQRQKRQQRRDASPEHFLPLAGIKCTYEDVYQCYITAAASPSFKSDSFSAGSIGWIPADSCVCSGCLHYAGVFLLLLFIWMEFLCRFILCHTDWRHSALIPLKRRLTEMCWIGFKPEHMLQKNGWKTIIKDGLRCCSLHTVLLLHKALPAGVWAPFFVDLLPPHLHLPSLSVFMLRGKQLLGQTHFRQLFFSQGHFGKIIWSDESALEHQEKAVRKL